MYTTHFGLRELPFGITPDTSYFHPCPSSQRALNTLLVAANSGEGFIKITGEVGTGKTLLCRKFMSVLDPSFVTAYIPNPLLQPRGLMSALAEELRVPVSRDLDEFQILKAINYRLLMLARDGKRVLLCIDEAQAMPIETLEAVRLLTNLETEKRKLLQIVLFGQPELDRKLEDESIRQLRQRITFQYCLGFLDRAEAALYVRHRLQVAGVEDALFSPGALAALHAASRGVPRLLNILAHKSLMAAFGERRKMVDPSHVRAAAGDTPTALQKFQPPWAWLSVAVFVTGVVSVVWMVIE
ncbi:ExeA family protein [Lacisediminimonas profundi]|uniref:ExeA family protein n=1 Tax=Lacisediminimonas profundi TaxID=2603856 RepID=UPI00124B4D91|nr:AAA family ATPase [Lacisediminimonas profundi]